jgi:hypothetical protein
MVLLLNIQCKSSWREKGNISLNLVGISSPLSRKIFGLQVIEGVLDLSCIMLAKFQRVENSIF